jgi:hypothetical protein
MRLVKFVSFATVAFFVTALAFPTTSLAALGGDESSVAGDRAHMKASVRVTRTPSYAVHEMQSPAGTAVREYVSPAGIVFAVAWKGPFLPDLRQLLGVYFDQFSRAAKAPHRGHGPLLISEPGLVVQLAGHMRDFVGRAYLPEKLPDGVRAESIR